MAPIGINRVALFTLTAWFVSATLPSAAQPTSQPAATEPSPQTKIVFRLQRINVPAASKHREVKYDDNSPPDLRIEVYRNGNRIGDTSGAQEGYEVEFSEANEDNRFEIDPAGDPTFMIRMYDHDWPDPDDVVLTISNLRAADFHHPIYERLSENDPPTRRVEITFKRLD